MNLVRVLSTYDVIVGTDLISNLADLIRIKDYSKIFIITDQKLDKLWLNKSQRLILFKAEKIVVGVGEKTKTIETVKKIWKDLLIKGCDRKSLIINLGGGVIGDMGGFAASTFMRGVDFIQIPTTLLAMVDASVGGKVGIDFAGVKNLIGSFKQPTSVICDVNFLQTLPDREFVEGFGEIIKHGLIASQNYFNLVTSKKPREFSKEELIKIVLGSVKIKAKIVTKDEKEHGPRKLLNFGHTLGHAVEALSLETKHPFLHGEAVSIGMVAEAKISRLIGYLSQKDLESIITVLTATGLPIKFPNFSISKIIEKINKDKKSEKGKIKWTLLKSIGSAIINQKVDEKIVTQALKQKYGFTN